MLLTTNFKSASSVMSTLERNLFSSSLKLPKLVVDYAKPLYPYFMKATDQLVLSTNTSTAGTLVNSQYGRVSFRPQVNSVIPYYVISATDDGKFATWTWFSNAGGPRQTYNIKAGKFYVYVPEANVAVGVQLTAPAIVSRSYLRTDGSQGGSGACDQMRLMITPSSGSPHVNGKIPTFDNFTGIPPCLDPVCVLDDEGIDVGIFEPIGQEPDASAVSPCGHCTTLLDERVFHYGVNSGSTTAEMLIIPGFIITNIDELPVPTQNPSNF
jgi:hypothetical protein